MKIYGNVLSAPANKVRLTASALDIDFEYQELDFKTGEHIISQGVRRSR